MDKVKKYQAIAKAIIQRHNTPDDPGYDEFETQAVIDDQNGHYFLMDVGWNKMSRIHGCIIHLDVKNDKVWIQQDWTEPSVADELMEAGVPKEDIVLAFHAPYKRQYTGYAVA
ncbi:MAG: XisI protein [Saprospiraceae bacterium]